MAAVTRNRGGKEEKLESCCRLEKRWLSNAAGGGEKWRLGRRLKVAHDWEREQPDARAAKRKKRKNKSKKKKKR